MAGSGPTRTCCGCGEADERAELVRLTLDPDGRLFVDLRGRMPGRGAWVHPRAECVARIERKPGTLGRSLHATPPTDGLREAIVGAVQAAATEGLSMAAAGGALIGGRDLLTRALRDRAVVHVVAASDASDRTLEEYRVAAGPDVGFTVLPLDTSTLGLRVGKGPRAALGVRPSHASAHLLRQLRRLADLG